MHCTPRHITTSLQNWALATKQRIAIPLDFDPSYQAYWSENTRDTVFGASTNAFDTTSQASPFATRIIATISCIHLWDMHFNQLTPHKKLQQHSYSSLTGLVGVKTGI